MIRVLVVGTDGSMRVRSIEPDVATFTDLVGGYLEIVSAVGWHAYCDEEGKLRGRPVNERATALTYFAGFGTGDFLVGTVVFVGNAGSGEADVPAELLEVAGALGHVEMAD